MGTSFHFSNKTSWNVAETPNVCDSQKIQRVSLLEKLWHLYCGMQKQSPALNLRIGAQQPKGTRTATHCDDW
jgi:hypothetical protein